MKAMLLIFFICIIQLQHTLQTCTTPLECFTEAIQTLKQDRDEMRQTISVLNKKIDDLNNTVPKVKVKRNLVTLIDNMAYNKIVTTLNFKLPLKSKTTFAVIIQIYFVFNGANNTHGYLIGKLVQAGNEGSSDNIVFFDHQHFNEYKNTETVEYIVPWDPSKGDYLQMQITDSLNSDVKNTYKVSFVGEFTN